MSDHDGHEEADLQAAEYVLGVLDAAGRAAAEARMARDRAFAEDVARWTERLGPLAEGAPEAPPPPELWERIEASITPGAAASRPAAANDNAAGVRFWRRLALGASTAAAASVAAVVLLLARPDPAVVQVATLATPQGEATVMLAFNPRTRALLVTPGAGLRTGRAVPHLWLMEPGGGVRLVGAIDPEEAATHSLPEDLALRARSAEGAAVSLEPPGRTPAAAPAGPVVASGRFTRL
jgi:anti-sigma-K factor RskA